MSDYLFDKQGEPDPEVERLEQLLRPLAYSGRPLRSVQRANRRRVFISVAAAACAALLTLLIVEPWQPHQAPRASWAASVRGDGARVDGSAIRGEARLVVGAWLETGTSRVVLRAGTLGTVELAPGTRARIVASGAAEERLRLERGQLVARIDAPPRRFVVEIPRAVVTDLGCAFELTVDESGRGRLVVTQGKVAVSDGAGELVVPAGARCELSEHGATLAAPAPTPTPTPSMPTPSMSTPTPTPAPPPTKTTRAPKPHHAIKHEAPASKSAPASAPAERTSAPAQKPDRTRIEHDSLKDLERSAP